MLRFKLHETQLSDKFFKNNINVGFKSIKIKKNFFKILLIYTVNSHINKDLKISLEAAFHILLKKVQFVRPKGIH